MKLTVIGCSGSVPGPAGPASAYLVEHDGFRLLLDLGSGAFGALQRHVDPAAVDAVVLSHLHPDHCLDLCPYVVYHRYAGSDPLPRLPLLGPAETHDRIAAAYDPGSRSGLGDVFDVAAVTAGERGLGPFRLRFERMSHPGEAYAVRLEAEGRTLTYSGDTAPSDALVRLAAGSDVLLCEASYAEPAPGKRNPPGLHMTGREAGEHATAAGAGRLMLTHIPPWIDARRTAEDAAGAFAGRSELVAAGSVYDL